METRKVIGSKLKEILRESKGFKFQKTLGVELYKGIQNKNEETVIRNFDSKQEVITNTYQSQGN